MLKPGGQVDGDEALEFYAKHTAQIEVTRRHLRNTPALGAERPARAEVSRSAGGSGGGGAVPTGGGGARGELGPGPGDEQEAG